MASSSPCTAAPPPDFAHSLSPLTRASATSGACTLYQDGRGKPFGLWHDVLKELDKLAKQVNLFVIDRHQRGESHAGRGWPERATR